ncbi:hypothetical protein DKT69_10350 [Micromonospora sicca]|uniref:Uncharacterized protein n=1 Tax=Micromonospora sicca TaxID=2202420 RepID=A0A317DRW3_9ACTN|nr:hypothetical protein DKT69_10350 [Micromonospora sp. 4G51]
MSASEAPLEWARPVIATTLQSAIDAGCDDLTACAASSCCPLPRTVAPAAGAPARCPDHRAG